MTRTLAELMQGREELREFLRDFRKGFTPVQGASFVKTLAVFAILNEWPPEVPPEVRGSILTLAIHAFTIGKIEEDIEALTKGAEPCRN